jgi:hypothetical protein
MAVSPIYQYESNEHACSNGRTQRVLNDLQSATLSCDFMIRLHAPPPVGKLDWGGGEGGGRGAESCDGKKLGPL